MVSALCWAAIRRSLNRPARLHAVSPATSDTHDRVQRVPLSRIRPSALQPRKEFAPEALQELADSIREQGIVQPLIVRDRGEFFELIAGERRWRAAQLLNLPEVPIITREADDRAVLELALIENLQRENLNALEEALGYQQLAEQFRLTQEEISVKVGKSRAAVANATRLLKLPVSVQTLLRDGRISVGHAKVILGLVDTTQQTLAAERIVKEGLNVRQTEGLIAVAHEARNKKHLQPETVAISAGDPHVADLEAKLREVFATKVKLNYTEGKGCVKSLLQRTGTGKNSANPRRDEWRVTSGEWRENNSQRSITWKTLTVWTHSEFTDWPVSFSTSFGQTPKSLPGIFEGENWQNNRCASLDSVLRTSKKDIDADLERYYRNI